MSERSLGESAQVVTEEEHDVTLDEWIAGVRGYRVGVDLVTVDDPDGSVSQQIDEIADEIDRLPDGPEVDALIAEAQALQARVVTRRRFVVEQRSEERQRKVRADSLEELGLVEADFKVDESLDDDGKVGARRKVQQRAIDVAFRLILDALVLPDGVTLDDLRHLHETAPDQIDALVDAMARANRGAASSKVVLRDFSQRQSNAPKTPAS